MIVISDNVDRRSGQRADGRHRVHRRGAAGRTSVHRQVDTEADAEEGTPQHHVHVPGAEHGRSHLSQCQAAARG